MDGIIRFDHFEGDAFLDPVIRGLLGRTVSKPHNETNEYLGRVLVTLKDGTILREQAVTPFGRGPTNPMSMAELKDKFMDCAVRSQPATVSERLFDAVMTFDRLPNVSQLTAILEEAPPRRP
jgi:2-methylcitrate dehydratase MmgE/PrpD-like protein